METDTNRLESQDRRPRPSLDFMEVQRARKLSNALHEIGAILVHRDMDGASIVHDVARLVAEIAILDRVSPGDDLDPYFWRFVETLSVDPWGETMTAWEAVQPAIEAFQKNWAAHQGQALLKSEPAPHRHVKLVDLAAISASLGLTRPALREVFGTEKTALPPVRMNSPSLSDGERAHIRTLARRLDFTAEHLRDLALVEGGEEAFCNTILARELLLVEQDRIDRNRIEHSSDLTISRSVGRNIGKIRRKPGPKPKAETIGSLVASTAKLLRVSTDTVKRELRALRGVLHLSSCPEMSESSAELHLNYRGVAPELLRSVIPGFSPSLNTGIAPSKLEICSAMLEIVREAYRRPKTYAGTTRTTAAKVENRRLYDAENVALVKRWYSEVHRSELTDRQVWHLGSAGHLAGYVLTAKLWQSEKPDNSKPAVARQSWFASMKQGEKTHDDAVGFVRRGSDRKGPQVAEAGGFPSSDG